MSERFTQCVIDIMYNYAGLKGVPLLGCVPMLLRNMKKQTAMGENIFYNLHSKLGPIYRLKMLGTTEGSK